MAHLIKLEDYISRYEVDIHRYPSQFTRLKKERWYYVKSEWERVNQTYRIPNIIEDLSQTSLGDSEGRGFFSEAVKRLKALPFLKRNEVIDSEHVDEDKVIKFKAKTIEELKKMFYDDLFESQIRWASSSLLEHSRVNPKYRYDKWLKFFLQQLPDNYLVLYYPIFYIKQAPIDMEIIIISPTDVYCITMVEANEHSVFEASTERFWLEFVDKNHKRILSPLIGLNRMAGIIKGIYEEAEAKLPIKRIVLCPYSIIDNKAQGVQAEFIDKRTFESWTDKLKKHPSPIKSVQLKVAKALLASCQTRAYKRQDIELGEDHEF
ncbi:NERD domain-containing protein [Bacillus sp. FJAT-45350]|uniref:NERD domain-containing protein n=1 Tax=Bacillus sp. FJAT-45350 TaxID=2011014 RepID=UPI000BB96F76|nr:NERD domain-containing protein [Bacillus sp. FJAT-45350]